jgi:hypothetical protein
MSEVEPQGTSNPDNGSIHGSGLVGVGAILLAIGILLGAVCLPLAFEDPSTSCAAGHDCIALVDFRPIGQMGVVVALVAGVSGAWMVVSGLRPPDEPQ